MTELPKCGMVQRDTPRKCQNFVFKDKKNKFDKIWNKIDLTVEFFF